MIYMILPLVRSTGRSFVRRISGARERSGVLEFSVSAGCELELRNSLNKASTFLIRIVYVEDQSFVIPN